MGQIYLVEDLEFKRKFKGLSLYKVGRTRVGIQKRILGLQNWKNLKLLFYKDMETYGEEHELRNELITTLNGFRPFSGWRDITSTDLITPDIRNFLKTKYLPPMGTKFKHWGGGLTEYFIVKE